MRESIRDNPLVDEVCRELLGVEELGIFEGRASTDEDCVRNEANPEDS